MPTPKSIRPLHDNVLVRRKDAEKVTAGGLFIPDNRQTKNRYCEVLAVGPGRFKEGSNERIPTGLKPGQIVFVRGTAGREIELEGEKGYLFVEAVDIEAVVETP